MGSYYPTTVVQNLSEYLEIVHKGGGYTQYQFYRGQQRDWSLKPRIFRRDMPLEFVRWGDFENYLVSRFSSLASPHLNAIFSHKLEWLTVGQHHGLPTRLLDWTESPLTALFFALEKLGNENESVVWKVIVPKVYYLDANGIHALTQQHAPLRILVPKHLTNRHTSQRAVFSYHPMPQDRHLFTGLEQIEDTERSFDLEKIVIPAENRDDIRLEIDRLGIDHFSIFNDLDHLCQKLDWEIEREQNFGDRDSLG